MRFVLITIVSLGLAISTGCSTDKPPEAPPTASEDPRAGAQDKDSGQDPTKGDIHIDSKLAKLCSIPDAYFSFDSANLGAQAKNALDKLAQCFVSGAAKDESMRIVGHADPRGETDYNFALGQRRAGSVEQVLTRRGVPADRIESSSRGELEASGTDEAGWSKDRRVDIVLAD